MISLETKLREALCTHPRRFNNRYDQQARRNFLQILFHSLTNDNPAYFEALFPAGVPNSHSLAEAQGAQDETEYTEAARGTPCGHILRAGEAKYFCATCTDNPTVILCARCFSASDHEGHSISVSFSNGNSGCCDCGDEEAWTRTVRCAIHSVKEGTSGDVKPGSQLPEDLRQAARITISTVLDYFCDVISCSQENLRDVKTNESVIRDETKSRLSAEAYSPGDEIEMNPEYCLVIWNDEKHTLPEVQDQVMRSCRQRKAYGTAKAREADAVGRSVISQTRDLSEILRQAKVMEEIKLSITIRSSRDTYREDMCATVVEWLNDIAGCIFFADGGFLRYIICEQLLTRWHPGSQAWNRTVGKAGLFDNEAEDNMTLSPESILDPVRALVYRRRRMDRAAESDLDEEMTDNDNANMDDDDDEDEDDLDQDEDEEDYEQLTSDVNDAIVEVAGVVETTSDGEADTDGDVDFLDAAENLDEHEPLPPPPPPPAVPNGTQDLLTARFPPHHSGLDTTRDPNTASNPVRGRKVVSPPYWRFVSEPRMQAVTGAEWEDLKSDLRVDSMILFDLRLWKKLRNDLRDLFIATLIKVPSLKRALGLRFAGVYNTLAQLYLVNDREPDHSIVHLSVQLMTTPSIAEELVDKANFLTNLMAILYTFLTTRHVGLPDQVDPSASLAFNEGAVANRRILQFFFDFRYYLAIPAIRVRIRDEAQYLPQFLDLAKLCQGICPNVRAVGEHVEYENDTWIAAQWVMGQMNKHCREISDAFKLAPEDASLSLALRNAITQATKQVLLVCTGLDDTRYPQSEVKGLVKLHDVETMAGSSRLTFRIVNFELSEGVLSFHHPLHYILSWFIEHGRNCAESVQVLREAACDTVALFKSENVVFQGAHLAEVYDNGQEALLAVFDYPLRVCAWLAQIRAGLWVRNGMSLRHQAQQYKNLHCREVAYHRDIFSLQIALVTCNPGSVLAAMIDRFGLREHLLNTDHRSLSVDDSHVLGVLEDFTSLVIILLTSREALSSKEDGVDGQTRGLRHEIAHILCFKSLSYTDLAARLTERNQEHELLQTVLEEMTTFKPPEGLHDSGMFELKPEYLAGLDPYSSNFSKNQRDEAENIYKNYMAKKLDKSPDDVVLEPKLLPIRSAAFMNLCAVVRQPLFAVTICRLLKCGMDFHKVEGISVSKVETFINVVLQLTIVAAMENMSLDASTEPSFIYNASTLESGPRYTLLHALHDVWTTEKLSGCHSKVKHVLKLFHRKQPSIARLASLAGFEIDRLDTASPVNHENKLEAKKKQATERKARVMAQMQQQQQSFMNNQDDMDWSDDNLSDSGPEMPTMTETRLWKFPSDVCIHCREETNDERFYGVFAMMGDTHVLRETPAEDAGYIREVLDTPESLDRALPDNLIPFGVAGDNVEKVVRMTADGKEEIVPRRCLSRGWPKGNTRKGVVMSGCGHLMHYACFEHYFESIRRRHQMQIPRRQPERVQCNEFVCPLCKAINNTFLPITYKASRQSYPGVLDSESSYEFFLEERLPAMKILAAMDPLQREEHVQKEELKLHYTTITSFTVDAMVTDDRPMLDTSGDFSAQTAEALLGLAKIYERLQVTLDIVSLTQADFGSESPHNTFQTLLHTISNAIAAVEIANRGRCSAGSSLIDNVGSSTLSHLQVLAHSARAYAATMSISSAASNGTKSPYQPIYERLLQQLMQLFDTPADLPSLLLQDGFASFVSQALVLHPMQAFPINHCLRLSLTAELIRVAMWWLYGSQSPSSRKPSPVVSPRVGQSEHQGVLRAEDNRAIAGFVFWLSQNIPGRQAPALLPYHEVAPLYKALRTYALIFMRRAVVFLHVGCGVDFPSAPSLSEKPELDRLLSLCKLPDLCTIFSSFSEFTVETTLPKMASSWLRALYRPSSTPLLSSGPTAIRLSHPAPFELVGLPEHYDILIEEGHKRRCPMTGKEIADPALCLFCGDIFCAQTSCCMRDEQRGGCNHHITHCSAPLGIYLLVRKCIIVFLETRKNPKKVTVNRALRARITGASQQQQQQQQLQDLADETDIQATHGSFFPAPYLTRHGETDQGLRTKQQLMLNRRRYEKLVKDVWLGASGGIGSAIARKLDADVNAGGWETL